MKDNPNQIFFERVKFLEDFVTSFDMALGVTDALRELQAGDIDDIDYAIYKIILPPLEQRLVLYAAQLTDQNSDTNLKKTLSHYKQHKGIIDHEGEPLSNEKLDDLMDFSQLSVEKIQRLRNKTIAHLDKEFTQAPSAFVQEINFEWDIIENVLRHAQTCISGLTMATENRAAISMGRVAWASVKTRFSAS